MQEPVKIIYRFGDIRKDYAKLEKTIAAQKLDADYCFDELNVKLQTSCGFLYPNHPSSEYDNKLILSPTNAELYWAASRQIRTTLDQSSNNLPWPLRFFSEYPKTTAGILLGTFETVSTGITYSINKDVLTNIYSNSMLAVYLSPVAAAILTFVAVAYITKKDQDLDSSNNTYQVS